jgi:hypothetical protein
VVISTFNLGSSDEKTCKVLVGKQERKRPLRIPRRGRDSDIRRDLREIGYEGVDWIHLTQYRGSWRAVVNTVMKLRVP